MTAKAKSGLSSHCLHRAEPKPVPDDVQRRVGGTFIPLRTAHLPVGSRRQGYRLFQLDVTSTFDGRSANDDRSVYDATTAYALFEYGFDE